MLVVLAAALLVLASPLPALLPALAPDPAAALELGVECAVGILVVRGFALDFFEWWDVRERLAAHARARGEVFGRARVLILVTLDPQRGVDGRCAVPGDAVVVLATVVKALVTLVFVAGAGGCAEVVVVSVLPVVAGTVSVAVAAVAVLVAIDPAWLTSAAAAAASHPAAPTTVATTAERGSRLTALMRPMPRSLRRKTRSTAEARSRRRDWRP